MKVKYDKSVDAVYINLINRDKSTYPLNTHSLEIDNIVPFGEVNIDFDERNLVVGIEILNASKYLPKDSLKNITTPEE